jgi:M6 family metalloprotease-like protein
MIYIDAKKGAVKMKKKPLAFLVSLTMLCTIATNLRVEGAAPIQKQFVQTMPSYQKLDKELILETKANGTSAVGKDLHGYNGKAYVKPGNTGDLNPLDVTGKDKRGIAILVDFPIENTEGKISDVPGVDFAPIPVNQFEGLLNGTIYNPYDLPMFSWIKTEAEKLGITPATDRTLNNYYKEVSYDKFKINVDVKGWYTLPHSYEHYLGQNNGYYNENGDAHIGELVKDAIALADEAGVDFSQYAVDAKSGDFADLYGESKTTPEGISKIVPNIFIIHRGTGAEYSRDPQIIWSHKWDILSASYYGNYYRTGSYPADETLKYEVVDGVVVNTYNICPEVGQDITEYFTKPAGIPKREPSPVDPGVFAHEFGHVLGLPDQYDYGYDSEGTGMFTLMAGGSYGRDVKTSNTLLNRYFSGFSPVHMDAWSKYYLGFINPTVITREVLGSNAQTITLQSAAQLPNRKGIYTVPNYYKIVVPGSNGKEYFLLENRQQIGYDKGLAYTVDGNNLHGLVVYHVDETVLMRNFNRPNEAANWDWNNRGANYQDSSTGENHYGIAVVQADGKWDMEKYVNDGDSGDAFPGTGKVTALTPNVKSSINTTSYYMWGTDSRSYTGITIDNIVEKNGVITARVYFK